MKDASELFEAAGSATADPNLLERLNKAADELLAMEDAVAQMEEDLKGAKTALNLLRTKTMPELMNEAQMDSFTRNGRVVEVSDFVSGSLPKEEDKREKAIKWLETHDGAGLIKTSVGLSFGRGQHNEALALVADLKARELEPTVETGVHAATLQAFARERLKKGAEIDTDVLGLYTGRVVKVKEAKKGKGR